MAPLAAPLVLTLILHCVTVADSTTKEVLVPHGDSVNLYCPYSSISSHIDWAMVMSGDSYKRIVSDCRVHSDYTSLYEVSAATRCDLVILNASKPHGGKYVCYNADGVMHDDEIHLSVLGNCLI